ncbi:hypothetical protein [Erwinia sp.]|uniref:hypothetical protein n=1 Tax=Erwinia citreus TaxID=558 RepID=UPI003C73103A
MEWLLSAAENKKPAPGGFFFIAITWLLGLVPSSLSQVLAKYQQLQSNYVAS